MVYIRAIFLSIAASTLVQAAPVRTNNQLPLSPDDLPPLSELPATVPVDVWSAGVSHKRIAGSNEASYCHVPRYQQMFRIEQFDQAPGPKFHATIQGSALDSAVMATAKLTVEVGGGPDSKRDEPLAYTAPLTRFTNIAFRHADTKVEDSDAPATNLVIDGLAPFRGLSPGQHSVRFHAMLPNGQTVFCFQTPWTAAKSDADVWRLYE